MTYCISINLDNAIRHRGDAYITRKDGEDFRLYLNEIDVLENFEMLTFVKPVNSTTAIVEFEY